MIKVENEERYGKLHYPLFYLAYQNPNETIVMYPNTPHMGVNMGIGLNEAIAVYYGTSFKNDTKYSCQHQDFLIMNDKKLEIAKKQYLNFWSKNPRISTIRDNRCMERVFYSSKAKNRFRCKCGRFNRLMKDISKIRGHVSHCKAAKGYEYYSTLDGDEQDSSSDSDAEDSTLDDEEQDSSFDGDDKSTENFRIDPKKIQDSDKHFFKAIPKKK